jgi:hypothetical protein
MISKFTNYWGGYREKHFTRGIVEANVLQKKEPCSSLPILFGAIGRANKLKSLSAEHENGKIIRNFTVKRSSDDKGMIKR